ncbi:MAG TPA: SAM-dependent methyltransferase [Streptosporangiaceae bacterium]
MIVNEPVPVGVAASRPSIARVYDCFLGGTDNFAVDREVFARALAIAPESLRSALDNRAFLWRVVHYLAAEAGIRQFLDIGPGLPTRGNVHEAARDATSSARVVYVDNDPMVLAHGRALLAGDRTATMISGDVREPEQILASPPVQALTGSGQPFALLLLGILHHLTDQEDPAGIAARLRRALPPGSYLAISHFHNPGSERPDLAVAIARGEKLLTETLGTGRWRSREEILAYFGDLELVEPGLVPLAEWRPSPRATHRHSVGHHAFLGAVALKK